MSRYRPKAVPSGIPQEIAFFLKSELEEISRSKDEPDQFMMLETSFSQPKKIVNGMIVLADGTNWNPGSGAGFYGYRNGAWRFLG